MADAANKLLIESAKSGSLDGIKKALEKDGADIEYASEVKRRLSCLACLCLCPFSLFFVFVRLAARLCSDPPSVQL